MHNFFDDHSNDQNTGFGNFSYFGESANDGGFDKDGFRPIRTQSDSFTDIGAIRAGNADTEHVTDTMQKIRSSLSRKNDLDHVASQIQKQDDKKFGISGFDKDGFRPIRTQADHFPDVPAIKAARNDAGSGSDQYNRGAQVERKHDLDDIADQIQNFDHSGTNNEKENDSTVKQESFFTSANRGIGSFFG